ncbi:MAG: ANTAR domain-containing response regulator [Solirubrobacterales bacterium]
MANPDTSGPLKVMLANEDKDELERVATLVRELGHDVTALAVAPMEAANDIVNDPPDVSLLVVHHDLAHALEMIVELNEVAEAPVVAMLGEHRPEFVNKAIAAGVTAFVSPEDSSALRSGLDLARERQQQLTSLIRERDQISSAMERRAMIEQAKGILMERHGVGSGEAFEMLRGESRQQRRRVVDLACSVVESRSLLDSSASSR